MPLPLALVAPLPEARRHFERTALPCCLFAAPCLVVHRFLVSKCLQHEYVLAHGTALGAVRDQTIIPHTQDLDLAVTPLLIQFLELNSTREELWRHGYAVFMGEDVFWK